MARCKCCNKIFSEHEIYSRIIHLENGNTIKHLEDLCSKCRSKSYPANDKLDAEYDEYEDKQLIEKFELLWEESK